MEEDVLACIAYGSEMSRERNVDHSLGSARVKLKLDENLGERVRILLVAAGHDVSP